MPTYEYRCPEGHDFEDFVLKISDAKSELPCPSCGKIAARRMSAGSGLLFKGSGFYITDYGKDGKKDQRTAAKSDSTVSTSSIPSTTSTPSAPKAESKPAAAPAATSAPSKKSGTDK